MEQILYGVKLDDLLNEIGKLIDSKLAIQNNQPETKTDYLSRAEVAQLLKISLPTLNEWTKLGWLQSYKIGNRVLYKASEVTAALENVSKNKFKKYIK